MSNFVSAGTDRESQKRDDEWLAAQRAIEARRLAKLDAGKQEGGKSLYEVLQANKEAKEEAFQESIRLKHQFRSLDEDEVEFLDGIDRKARTKEAEVRRDANVQLEFFRAQQEEAERASKLVSVPSEPNEADSWLSAGRKRKKEREFSGIVKKRQLTSKNEIAATANKADNPDEQSMASRDPKEQGKLMPTSQPETRIEASAEQKAPEKHPALPGLVDYDSDDD